MFNTPEDRNTVQKEFNRLEKWAEMGLTKANAETGTDRPHATVLARYCVPGEPHCRNGHGVLMDKEGHESAVHPCNNKGKSNTGPH